MVLITGHDCDEELVTRLIAREEGVLSELYDLTIKRVYGLALKITGQPTLAEEVAEDTYWQVWQEIYRYDAQKCPLLQWMLMICRSRAIDALRKHKPFVELTAELERRQEDWHPSPETSLQEKQAQQVMRQAMTGLSQVQKQILHHAFYLGLSQQEIATLMQLPLGTVKSNMRRAQLTLKAFLKGQHVHNEYE